MVESATNGDNFTTGNGRQSLITSALSQEQIVSGLKEALAKGVQYAIANLGRTNGFLADAKVRIPMPENLRKVEIALRTMGEGKLADGGDR